MDGRRSVPAGVWIAAGFFAAGGALHLGVTLHDLPRPLGLWAVWGAVGRALLNLLLAWGLWRRMLCRSIAMVYCWRCSPPTPSCRPRLRARPVRFPDSIVWESLTTVPSCASSSPPRSARTCPLFARP
jgi:hypothetical protein